MLKTIFAFALIALVNADGHGHGRGHGTHPVGEAGEAEWDNCCSPENMMVLAQAGARCGPVDNNGMPLADPSQANENTNFQCFVCWDESLNDGVGGLDMTREGCDDAVDSTGEACAGFCKDFAESQAHCFDAPCLSNDLHGDCPNPMCLSEEAMWCGAECMPCAENPMGTTTSGEPCMSCMSCMAYQPCGEGKNPCFSPETEKCSENCQECGKACLQGDEACAAATAADGGSCEESCSQCEPYMACIGVDFSGCGHEEHSDHEDHGMDHLLQQLMKVLSDGGMSQSDITGFMSFMDGDAGDMMDTFMEGLFAEGDDISFDSVLPAIATKMSEIDGLDTTVLDILNAAAAEVDNGADEPDTTDVSGAYSLGSAIAPIAAASFAAAFM